MLTAVLGLAAGVLATLAALVVRRPLVHQLGEGYVRRFLAVQGLAINVVFFLVVRATADWVELRGAALHVGLPVAYGLLYFVYSLSNIDWTARKFHDL